MIRKLYVIMRISFLGDVGKGWRKEQRQDGDGDVSSVCKVAVTVMKERSVCVSQERDWERRVASRRQQSGVIGVTDRRTRAC